MESSRQYLLPRDERTSIFQICATSEIISFSSCLLVMIVEDGSDSLNVVLFTGVICLLCNKFSAFHS